MESYAQCKGFAGRFGQKQYLQALHSERQQVCGRVMRYGVNNEWGDARDIVINIDPSERFERFVQGFRNTSCTRFNDALDDICGVNDHECSEFCRDLGLTAVVDRCIHVEVTPPNQFYGADARWLPIVSGFGPGTKPHLQCASGNSCFSELEPLGGQDGRDVCVYGVWAYDHGKHTPQSHSKLWCAPDSGHDHPEIHPFDAIWFSHPERPGWVFGVFQDDSNRYSAPYCGGSDLKRTNLNSWSQAPRALTFQFPFEFPLSESPMHACLDNVSTNVFRGIGPGDEHKVEPLNVTTRTVFGTNDQRQLRVDGRLLVQVVELAQSQEARIDVAGRVDGNQVIGVIQIQVAVGCEGQDCLPDIDDPGDPGSGFLYDSLVLQSAPCSGT